MTSTTTYNIGDIIATILIGGTFLLAIACVITLIVILAKKRKWPQASGTDLNARIAELEKRVEQLENKY